MRGEGRLAEVCCALPPLTWTARGDLRALVDTCAHVHVHAHVHMHVYAHVHICMCTCICAQWMRLIGLRTYTRYILPRRARAGSPL